jgi:hypothetical protein
MKDFLLRLLLAAVVMLVAFGLSSSVKAQEAGDQAGSSGQPKSTARQQSRPAQDTKASLSDAQTLDALEFAGRLVKENGRILLKDAVTKMSYQLDDQSRARPYLGKQVRVVGKLDLDSNMIHIDRLEPIS